MASAEKNLARIGHSNHENKLHTLSNKYLFYVPEIHRTLGLMSEYSIQSDNCYKRRKAIIFSHRERKIQNRSIQLLTNKNIPIGVTHTLQQKREFTIRK